jgi:hypothetical protein
MAITASSLEDLHIAKPCPVSWADMKGDDRVRFCSHCSLHVGWPAGRGHRHHRGPARFVIGWTP